MTETKTSGEQSPQTSDDVIAIPGDPEQSVYRFIIVAAKRARQLQSGVRPKVQYPSKKMTRVAAEEVRRGLVPYIDPETAPAAGEGEEELPADQ
jgi:DNA-directed RNA polymerase subunit omega